MTNQHFLPFWLFFYGLSQHISTADGFECARKSKQLWHPLRLCPDAAVLDAFVTQFPSKTVQNSSIKINLWQHLSLSSNMCDVKWCKTVQPPSSEISGFLFITLALECNLLRNLMAFRASLDMAPHSGRRSLFPVTSGGLWLHRGDCDNGLRRRRPLLKWLAAISHNKPTWQDLLHHCRKRPSNSTS